MLRSPPALGSKEFENYETVQSGQYIKSGTEKIALFHI